MDTHDVWTDRLSDWLDGELSEREREAVRAHLEGCGPCRRVADELAEVRGRARVLGAVEPESDLWPAIAERLAGGTDADAVIDLTPHLDAPPVAPGGVSQRRGVLLRGPQLAAAAVVLLLGGWAVGTATGGQAPADSVGVAASSDAVRAASDLLGDPALNAGMADLERRFDERAERLGPGPRDRLAGNLASIDRALSESIDALRLEPTSPYLRAHIERGLDRRRTALESAVRLLERTE